MADERNDVQKAADEKLDAAIREAMTAYFGGGYVTEYAVAVHQLRQDGDEELDDVCLILPRGGTDIPVYRVMGLLAAGVEHAKGLFHSADVDTEEP